MGTLYLRLSIPSVPFQNWLQDSPANKKFPAILGGHFFPVKKPFFSNRVCSGIVTLPAYCLATLCLENFFFFLSLSLLPSYTSS
tara:strand:- start:1 stop:252 length:252 start_codon:yes stop_codon:yes gene_type:complete